MKKYLDAFKKWLANKKFKLAVKWITAMGMVPTRIVRRAGSDYIVSGKGEFHRIGRAGRG